MSKSICLPKYLTGYAVKLTNRIMSELAENTLLYFHQPKQWHLNVLSWKAALPGYEIVAEDSLSHKCHMKGTTIENQHLVCLHGLFQN